MLWRPESDFLSKINVFRDRQAVDDSVREWWKSTKFDDNSVREWCNVTKFDGDFAWEWCKSTKFSVDSSTFLQHWCPENKAKQRFSTQNVRQFYVFETLMSGKQSKTTIWRLTCATVLRFWNIDVRKTKQNNDSTTISENKKKNTKKQRSKSDKRANRNARMRNSENNAPAQRNSILRRLKGNLKTPEMR